MPCHAMPREKIRLACDERSEMIVLLHGRAVAKKLVADVSLDERSARMGEIDYLEFVNATFS
jgi:hypothetical protein